MVCLPETVKTGTARNSWHILGFLTQQQWEIVKLLNMKVALDKNIFL